MTPEQLLAHNLEILERRFPAAAAAVKKAAVCSSMRFVPARDGSLIVKEEFNAREFPLHSTVAPRREGERTAAMVENAGFVVSYGLGAGWHLSKLIEQGKTVLLLVDGADRLRTLLAGMDYGTILQYPGLILTLDPSPRQVEDLIVERYLPGFHGNLGFAPLAPLTSRNRERYEELRKGAEKALTRVRDDFSVLAHFGLLWTRNILANLHELEHTGPEAFTGLLQQAENKKIIIAGAGPSLRSGLDELKNAGSETFLLAVDTALPVLLESGILPDAVISIDSQFYTLLHREHPLAGRVPWLMSLASPPTLVRSLSQKIFFSSGNPLEKVAAAEAGLASLDTQGGNVLQTAISFASLGNPREIRIFGADYSNPAGIPYCSGTYVDRWFQVRECRTASYISQRLCFTFDSRSREHLDRYDPLYPSPRLSLYRERMTRILSCLPFPAVLYGAAGSFTSEPGPGGKTEKAGFTQSGQNIPVDSHRLLKKIRSIAETDSAEALQILYPLASYLRLKGNADVHDFAELLQNTRNVFLKLANEQEDYSGSE